MTDITAFQLQSYDVVNKFVRKSLSITLMCKNDLEGKERENSMCRRQLNSQWKWIRVLFEGSILTMNTTHKIGFRLFRLFMNQRHTPRVLIT